MKHSITLFDSFLHLYFVFSTNCCWTLFTLSFFFKFEELDLKFRKFLAIGGKTRGKELDLGK